MSGYIKEEMGGSRKWAGAIRTDAKLVTHAWTDDAPAYSNNHSFYLTTLRITDSGSALLFPPLGYLIKEG